MTSVISRRTFVTSVTGGLLAAPHVVEAQQAGKVPRVGVLGGQSVEISPPVVAIREGLRELGCIEGQNIAFEWRWAHGKDERFSDLAAQLVQLKVDVIVAPTPSGAQAAHLVTRTIPIVMVFVGDPVALGLVASLARPGGNITGFGVPTAEVIGKRLQLLMEAAPTTSRIAFLSDPSQPGMSAEAQTAKTAAQALGVQLQVWEARTADELDRTFASIARRRPVGILVPPSTAFYAYRERIADLAARYHLPTSGWIRDLTEAGCLMSYGSDPHDLARHAAVYVDKILKGAKPADLPIEQPTKFELVINLKTAKALGLMIPPSVLARADEVIP